jgi:hypothetical protein
VGALVVFVRTSLRVLWVIARRGEWRAWRASCAVRSARLCYLSNGKGPGNAAPVSSTNKSSITCVSCVQIEFAGDPSSLRLYSDNYCSDIEVIPICWWLRGPMLFVCSYSCVPEKKI